MKHVVNQLQAVKAEWNLDILHAEKTQNKLIFQLNEAQFLHQEDNWLNSTHSNHVKMTTSCLDFNEAKKIVLSTNRKHIALLLPNEK